MTNAHSPRPSASAAIDIDIVIASPLWHDVPAVETILERALTAALPQDAEASEVAVMLTDDAEIRTLNRQWRNQDHATNVLSFPQTAAAQGTPRLLGDIVIAYETTAKEAADEGKPLPDHLSHLAVHGLLHLLGYDHESDEQAEIMENLERRILAQLGVPDPYAARDADA
jgi:probable rRNA maturation factor